MSSQTNEQAIIHYLNQVNRPYSIVEISQNIKLDISKTALLKLCTNLVEKGKIHGKLYGKQWIYCAKQDDLPAPSPDELCKMDMEIDKLKQEIHKCKDDMKSTESELSRLESAFTDDVLQEKLQDLESQVASIQSKVTQLKQGTLKVSPEEKALVEKEWNSMQNLCKKRKAMFRTIWDQMTESYPGKANELAEELGIELS